MGKGAKVFNFIVLIYPILDIIYSINTTILKINLPINQAVRFLFMLYLLRYVKKKSYIVIGCLFSLLTIGEITYAYQGNMVLSGDIAYLIKLMFFVIVIYGVEGMLEQKVITPFNLMRLMVTSSYVICISIILSKFGLGFNSYDYGRTGVKGLFTVQNTVSATLLAIFPLSLIVYEKTKKIRYLINYLLIFLSLIMIGTKSGIAGALIISIVQIFIWFIKTKMTYLKLIVGSFSLAFLAFISPLIVKTFNELISAQQNVYSSFGYTNVFSFLISNRDLQITAINDYVVSISNPTLFWGLGYSFSNGIVNLLKSDFQSIEMDFYGLYYYSGIWVLILISALILKKYVAAIYNMFKTKFGITELSLFLSLTALLIQSFYGGHVVYEALTEFYFCAILGISKYKYSVFKMEQTKAVVITSGVNNSSSLELGR